MKKICGLVLSVLPSHDEDTGDDVFTEVTPNNQMEYLRHRPGELLMSPSNVGAEKLSSKYCGHPMQLMFLFVQILHKGLEEYSSKIRGREGLGYSMVTHSASFMVISDKDSVLVCPRGYPVSQRQAAYSSPCP